MDGAGGAGAGGFAGCRVRKFPMAVLLQVKFPSCMCRARVEVPRRICSPFDLLGGCSWSCILGTGTGTGAGETQHVAEGVKPSFEPGGCFI